MRLRQRSTEEQQRIAKRIIHAPGVQQVVINDLNNPFKAHVFRLYRDGHKAYNQMINGMLFYPAFERCTQAHGYYGYLEGVRR